MKTGLELEVKERVKVHYDYI